MSAAEEIAQLAQRILKLAPEAGLYVGISIKPAQVGTHPKGGDGTAPALLSDAVAEGHAPTPKSPEQTHD